MRGGLQLINGDNFCTSSFSAYGLDVSDYFILSAAHCAGYYRRNGPDGHYGGVDEEQDGGNVDAERIRHLENPWTTVGEIYANSGGQVEFRDITSYMAYTAYTEGTFIGMSGAGSNDTNRGNITDAYHSAANVSNGYHFVRADYCRAGGDSGAPVFRNNTAYGIHSGSDGGACDANFGRIAEAIDTLDVYLISGS